MCRLTVIVPAYNVDKYIERCLDSLVNQTYKNLQIIVVNDGSKDQTEILVKKYEEKYENLMLFNKENGGLSSARNFGLKYTKTEYVTFVDGDDYLETNAYEIIMKKIESENTELGVFNFKKVYFNKIINSKLNKKIYEEDFLKYLFPKSKEVDIVVWNKIFKTDIIIKNQIYFENRAYFEDTGFIFRYLYFVKKISLEEQPLYNYIQRENSITKKFNPIIIKSYQNTYNIIKKFYLKNNKYLEYIKEIEDMKLRMEMYVLNCSLISNIEFNFEINIGRIIKSKIPVTHKIALFLYKCKIYKIIYRIYLKRKSDGYGNN